jgi:putative PIN family toxin of toxin-antitoxin system
MLVVLDTNILVSGLRSNQGSAFQILTKLYHQEFTIALSTALILEYEDVLKRPEMKIPLSFDQIEDVLDYLASIATKPRLYYTWRPAVRDPKDDHLLELAWHARVDYIVTYNIRDFQEARRFDIEAIRPVEFLQRIKP